MVQETEPRARPRQVWAVPLSYISGPFFKNLRQNASKFQAFSIAGVIGVSTCVHAHVKV